MLGSESLTTANRRQDDTSAAQADDATPTIPYRDSSDGFPNGHEDDDRTQFDGSSETETQEAGRLETNRESFLCSEWLKTRPYPLPEEESQAARRHVLVGGCGGDDPGSPSPPSGSAVVAVALSDDTKGGKTVIDESMYTWKAKDSKLPPYIRRKPEPLGAEFKTIHTFATFAGLQGDEESTT
ncbi:hypothetical protein THAOC_06801 [Thalassiosira oceanica]|uniref:Uncharacterized protein n=1 Tax=Thalassiosira oceanica TaxID=159749 RepID=K0SZI3_THAOC|nr:hypothetical protein THAOC_06801 [Thalassiosira oceanica]|mmetsp:Transcript_5749/g.13070  ORF Transcript_5749/g.13070 Transcript_5749/m.13070 type:complete len:183 (-) Transcript_5749:1398-1946(-)|eukprot:EJK71728.1 hypothetical protein THAOC_06801 [Thalassiosira oceanica]